MEIKPSLINHHSIKKEGAMSEKHHLTRREFIRKSGNLVAAGSVMALLPTWAAAAKPLVVGYIYVGPRQDFGWNQAHWEGAKKVAKMPGVKVVEQENVPETAEVEKVMKSMIELDGARIIVGTSFGYWKHLKKLALVYPDVLFLHIAALWKEGDPKNTVGFRGYTEEPHYLCGIAAGRMTKTNRIGFIGAKPLYFVFNSCNAFILGAQSVNPAVTCNVVITGDWNKPVMEAETTNSMIDQGCDVIIADVDSSKISMENAEKRGVYCCEFSGTERVPDRSGIQMVSGSKMDHGLADGQTLPEQSHGRFQARYGWPQPLWQGRAPECQGRDTESQAGLHRRFFAALQGAPERQRRQSCPQGR
jgi:simple sugar transport system substrate-binding protein